jgi:predicted Rossmann fold nucleotide-binding protein DprA/Smf involved in DNA uptake
LVNSSLFYWFYSGFSDCEHINDALVRSFKIPGSWSEDNWVARERQLAQSLSQHSQRKTINTKQGHKIEILSTDARYPQRLQKRLVKQAPRQLTALGNLDLLALPKTALFCSARTPGQVILSAHDQAARWRDEGHCVIGGFHSPLEKDCLRILLRGRQP